jgi:nucleoside-diphosphate-sugar epimerase
MAGKGKVLVTGASGFIGGHCVRELLENGYDVRGTVRDATDGRRFAHLSAVAARTGRTLELVSADLTRDAGWAEAVRGCTWVCHVASPFPKTLPEHEDDIVRPAVEGTRRVLEACAAAGGVKRVVLTSSLAAILHGTARAEGRVFTEADWSDPAHCEPYQKSKTLAERAAWELVEKLPAERRFELAVINPGFVLGPLLDDDPGTSGELVRRLLVRDMPACPQLGFAVVDVRDVALAHRLALETPRAAGNRYVCAGDHFWMRDMARILAQEFGPRGYRVPTGHLPYWVLWLIARFDPTIRLTLDYIGKREVVDNRKIRDELGMEFRPIRRTLVDMAESMIERGVVPRAQKAAA